ncbi:hypothetical protein [Halosolutus halophilus]|uniref:hypothetical protein n=1 Tax=Halosolutus halophilus TaxID=1552990 RepID=UPI0022350800|nr:hypothetical protein [Halosolutus halophilus]
MPDLFTTEEAGVTVTKHVDADGDEVRIGLRLESSRDRPLTVRVLDAVPAETTVEIPTTNPPRWSTVDDTVEYERTLESEESVTTGYKYTRGGTGAEAGSHYPPTLVIDEAARGGADAVATSDEGARGQKPTAATRGSEATPGTDGEQESAAHGGTDVDDFEMPEDEVSVADIVDDSATDSATPSTGPRTPADGGTATVDTRTTAATGAADGAVDDGETIDDLVDTVLRTLDADATPAQRDRLARELGDIDGSRSSLELRVTYLQSRFQDLAAYLDAMEEFLDDHGSGEDVLTEVLDDLHAVREQLDRVRDEQVALETRLDTVEDRTGQLESAFESRHDAVEGELRRLEDAVADVEETQRTVRDEVEQFTAFRDAIQDAFRGEALPTDD